MWKIELKGSIHRGWQYDFSGGLNWRLLKLAEAVVSEGDALISMTNGDDLGCGFTSELIHIVVGSLG